jgi:hypothetical protein
MPLSFSGVVVSHPSWLVVAPHLITLLPPVCRHLCLPSCRCLLLSTMTGCCVAASTFPCATASHPPGPPPHFICWLSFCQLCQWEKASIPNNHEGNGNGNNGSNGNSNSNGGGNSIRDFSSIFTPISLSLFDCCMFISGFGFVALLSLPHHLPPLSLPHLRTTLLPTASLSARHLPPSLADC